MIASAAVIAATVAGPALAEPTGQPQSYTDHTPPVVAVKVLDTGRKRLRFDGVQAQVTLNEPGTFSVVVRDTHSRQISAGNTGIASVPDGGTVTVSVRLTQKAKAQLRRGDKVRWTVVATALDGVGNRAKRVTRLWVG